MSNASPACDHYPQPHPTPHIRRHRHPAVAHSGRCEARQQKQLTTAGRARALAGGVTSGAEDVAAQDLRGGRRGGDEEGVRRDSPGRASCKIVLPERKNRDCSCFPWPWVRRARARRTEAGRELPWQQKSYRGRIAITEFALYARCRSGRIWPCCPREQFCADWVLRVGALKCLK